MYKTILIVALCLIGIFIHPFEPGFMDFVYRFIVFSFIVYLVYNMYQQTGNSEEEPQEHLFKPLSSLIKDDTVMSNEWHLSELINSDDRTKQ